MRDRVQVDRSFVARVQDAAKAGVTEHAPLHLLRERIEGTPTPPAGESGPTPPADESAPMPADEGAPMSADEGVPMETDDGAPMSADTASIPVDELPLPPERLAALKRRPVCRFGLTWRLIASPTIVTTTTRLRAAP